MFSQAIPWGFDPSKQLIGWLIRHGELKNMNIWDGWGDYELSPEGHQQAEKAAQYLSFERIGRFVCSDVPRATQTMNYAMQACHVENPYCSYEPNLRPWNVSDEFTGKEKTPARIAAFKKYIDDPTLVIPGGESRKNLDDRVQVAYQYLATPYNGLPTAIFTHNSVIKALMGLDDIKEAVMPGGIVAVYMDEKGQISFEVVLGGVDLEKGVS